MADPASPPPEPTAAAAPAASMPEAAPAAPGDATEAAGELTLPEVLATASAWALALTKHLDQRSRVSLARASRGCWLWALEASPQATVTLLAHSALSESAWQARLAAATQALADRGAAPGPAETARGTKLLLRMPTPNPAAVKSLLNLPLAARQAVTELEVRRYHCPAPYKPTATSTTATLRPHNTTLTTTAGPQPQPPPPTFANLHTLTIKHMVGPLLNPARLPSLRALHVYLWLGRSHKTAHAADKEALAQGLPAQCASVGRYVPQLKALSVLKRGTGQATVPWSAILPTTTTTLITLTSTCGEPVDMLPLVLQRAPNLQKLGCPTCALAAGVSATRWAVTEVRCNGLCCVAEHLATWPQAPGKLRLMPADGDTLRMFFNIVDAQGLSQAVQQRLSHWQSTTPCQAQLRLPDPDVVSPQDAQAGLQAALRQLSVLPAGAEVFLTDYDNDWDGPYTQTISTLATVSDATQHFAIVLPVNGPDAVVYFSTVNNMQQGETVMHASLYKPFMHKVSDVGGVWPWASVRVDSIDIKDILLFPDPCGAQYEVTVEQLDVFMWIEWTSEMCARLSKRLQHLTFVITQDTQIMLYESCNDHVTKDQVGALQHNLQLLRGFRWRQGSPSARVNVTLYAKWILIPSLVTTLRDLPTFPAATLTINKECHWSLTGSDHEHMAGLVPPCYSVWELHVGTGVSSCTVEHVMAICMGASARGDECGRLCLCVRYRESAVTDEQRAQVEACVDEKGLGRWVGVEWEML